jgi:hypothetical protein
MIRAVEKDFWVQKYVVGALMKLNEGEEKIVPEFTMFDFTEAVPARLIHPSHARMFKAIGFQLKLAAQFQNVPRVVEGLLQSEVGIYVTKLKITRAEGEGRRRHMVVAAPTAGAGPQRAAAPTAAATREQPPSNAQARRRAEKTASAQSHMEMMAAEKMAEREGSFGAPQPGAAAAAAKVESKAVLEGPKQVQATGQGEIVFDNLVDVTIYGYVVDFLPQSVVTVAKGAGEEDKEEKAED